MSILDGIAELSHEFGTPDYVKGGGGNTSVKDDATLWVKPSGTTLAGMTGESFVAMDRAKIDKLFEVDTPDDASAREVLVKDIMAAAVMPGGAGRPSVEAPLHHTFSATYVVHTHPTLVNGLTCAVGGAAACAQLFPEAMWVDYIDPGYTLCMQVRKEIQAFAAAKGRQPDMLFLKNHGLFVAADTPEAIRQAYDTVMTRLAECYAAAGVSTELTVGPAPDARAVAAMTARIRTAVATSDAAAVAASGAFAMTNGPVTPDHIVYAKAYPFMGSPCEEAVGDYVARHGYPPRVFVTHNAVYGVGTSPTRAALALELAQDGALVHQLAAAFGGMNYMTPAALDFIDNWEVESYRQKQVE